MHEFWCDYVKPKYGEKGKFFYMDTDSFIVYIKTWCIYKDVPEDAESRLNTSNDELDRPLAKGENDKVIALTKDELGGKISTEFVGLQAKNL